MTDRYSKPFSQTCTARKYFDLN